MEDTNRPRALHVAIISLTAVGLWNVGKQNPVTTNLYKLFSILVFLSIVVYTSLHSITVLILLYEKSWTQLVENLTYFFTIVMSLYKVKLICSDLLRKIIKDISQIEDECLNSEEENVVRIQRQYAKIVNTLSIIYIIFTAIVLQVFILTPILRLYLSEPSPQDDSKMLFVFDVWYPFDREIHYIAGYWTEVVCCLGCFGYHIVPDIVFISLSLCSICQLKTLQYRLENLATYSLKFSKHYNITTDRAQDILSKQYVMFHQRIIRMMEDLNQVMSFYMLCEFLVSSFKLSFAMVQFIKAGDELFRRIVYVVYLQAIISALFQYYWFISEISFESSHGINTAIRLIDIHQLSKCAKKRLIMMLIRSSRPCKISLGPFCVISLDIFIKLLKASYYYVCVMTTGIKPKDIDV